MLVPLDAKQASPESAAGSLSKDVACHDLPSSKVCAIKNFPLMGSPITIPLCWIPEFHGV